MAASLAAASNFGHSPPTGPSRPEGSMVAVRVTCASSSARSQSANCLLSIVTRPLKANRSGSEPHLGDHLWLQLREAFWSELEQFSSASLKISNEVT